MKRRRRLPLLAALVTLAAVALAIGASSAFANGTLDWTGQGISGPPYPGELNSELCGDSADFGGVTPIPAGADANHYLLWIFTLGGGSNTITSATLHVNGDTYGPRTPGGGQIKFVTPLYTLDPTVTDASVDYVGNLGDGNPNLTISHGCAGKFKPELTTEASVEGEAQAGSDLSDTAFLTGGSTNPVMGGTVDFALYNLDDDPTCEGTPIFTDDDVPVTGEADGTAEVTSDSYTVLEKGTYSWVASYSGDDNNEPAGPNDCGEELETVLFDAAAPTVVTEIHLLTEGADTDPVTVITAPYEVALGSTVHDKGTVTGPQALGTPEGDVDFKFWKGDDCVTEDEDETPPVQIGNTSNVALDTNGVAHPSANFGPLGAGSYFFTAHFNSDNEDVWQGADSLCEPLTVNKGQLDVDTILHQFDDTVVLDGGHVPLGTQMHDTAQLNDVNANFEPENDITFAFYTGTAEEPCSGTPVAKNNTGADAVSGDDRSEDTLALGAGNYGFKASIEGDDNYEGDTSDCEPFVVDRGTLSIVTYIHNDAHAVITTTPIGGNVHDTAAISGANTNFAPDLTKLSFTFYTGVNDCSNTGADAGNNGGALDSSSNNPRSNSQGPLAAGAYSFIATFAGDSNYKPVTAADVLCEPLNVRTYGKTQGFWGNQNGQALIPSTFTYTLGGTTGCYINVKKSPNNTTTILPNTKNGLSIIQNCSPRDPDINTAGAVGGINNLLSQTLALKLNIDYFGAGFAGQTLAGLNCTLGSTLTALSGSSTLTDVLTYANTVIRDMKSGVGAVITKALIGDLNALLGQCVNIEGP